MSASAAHVDAVPGQWLERACRGVAVTRHGMLALEHQQAMHQAGRPVGFRRRRALVENREETRACAIRTACSHRRRAGKDRRPTAATHRRRAACLRRGQAPASWSPSVGRERRSRHGTRRSAGRGWAGCRARMTGPPEARSARRNASDRRARTARPWTSPSGSCRRQRRRRRAPWPGTGCRDPVRLRQKAAEVERGARHRDDVSEVDGRARARTHVLGVREMRRAKCRPGHVEPPSAFGAIPTKEQCSLPGCRPLHRQSTRVSPLAPYSSDELRVLLAKCGVSVRKAGLGCGLGRSCSAWSCSCAAPHQGTPRIHERMS